MRKIGIKIIIGILIVAVVAALVIFGIKMTNKIRINSHTGLLDNYDDGDAAYDKESATYITLNGDSIETDSENVKFKNSTLTIQAEGIYVLSGNLNGNVVVDVDNETNVRIILNNANITSSDGSAIYGKNSDKIIITLDENSTNTLEDTSKYSISDMKATVFSNDDLTINGTGTLTVKANYANAIQSNDSVKIVNGTITINAVNNGIVANDDVKIKNGSINITSGNDGIKAKNEEDDTKGYVLVEGGNIKINAQGDGIQGVNYVEIDNGILDITTGGGASNTTKTHQENFRQMINQISSNSEDSESYKGIKAGNNIYIKNGTVNINSADDTLHSNGTLRVENGTLNISAGDDGMHADSDLVIDGGNIDIKDSYEGIEGATVTINGGDIKVKTSDDGINVAGGSDDDKSGFEDPFASNSDNKLTINGGKIYVNSDGDGLDSNGNIYLNDGTVYVDGPTNSGNGALDYNGEFVQQGGILIAVGSSGMAQAISSNSSVYALSAYLTSTQSANTKITLTDESGNEIVSYTPTKSFQHVVIATSSLKNGSKYNLVLNGTTYESFTISSRVTTIGSSQNSMGGGQMQNNFNGNGGMNRGR